MWYMHGSNDKCPEFKSHTTPLPLSPKKKKKRFKVTDEKDHLSPKMQGQA
jgi:hypothetical protein